MFIKDSKTQLSIEQQAEILRKQKEVQMNDKVRELATILVDGHDSFTRLSNKFLQENAETIYKLGPAWNLYTYMLSYSNWSTKDNSWAGLYQWRNAGLIVFCQDQKYIGEKLGISKSAVCHQMKKLERLSWIEIIPDYYFNDGHYHANVILLGYVIKVGNQEVGIWLSHICKEVSEQKPIEANTIEFASTAQLKQIEQRN